MRDFFSTDLVGSGKRCDDFELRRAFVTQMICAGLDWTDSENSHHFLFLATEASLQKKEFFSTPIEEKKIFQNSGCLYFHHCLNQFMGQ